MTATGMRTELGRIAGLTQRAETGRSPLELEVDRVSKFVAVLSVSIGATFFLVAGAIGMGMTERFVFALGVTVANLPSGLPPTLTLALALATQRMARRKAIVRRLSSVETLGATDVICTDKTGTLTANEMTVRRIWMPPDVQLDVEGAGYAPVGELNTVRGSLDPQLVGELLRAGVLCNNATLEPRDGVWSIVGDPTEGALLTLACKGGLDPQRESHRFPRRGELPHVAGQLVELGARVAVAEALGGTEPACLPRGVRAPVAAQHGEVRRRREHPRQAGRGRGVDHHEAELEPLEQLERALGVARLGQPARRAQLHADAQPGKALGQPLELRAGLVPRREPVRVLEEHSAQLARMAQRLEARGEAAPRLLERVRRQMRSVEMALAAVPGRDRLAQVGP